jgi:hypothetical protein
MWYQQESPELWITFPMVVEVRMKYVSGVLPNPKRTAAAIGVSVGNSYGNVLWIRGDEIFLWAGQDVIGPTATVDTDGSFHTYRIEVTSAGAIAVFYDNSQVLAWTMYYDHRFYGPSIWWGDGTGHAAGTSQWQLVRHNALHPASYADFDLDGVRDVCDNCPKRFNPTQSDSDGDGFGDACDDSCTRQKPGDVNGDGTIDMADRILLQNVLLCIEPLPNPGTNADFNGDCIVDTSDASALIRYLFMGFPTPVECTCVNPQLRVSCSNMCDSSTTDPVFLVCPGGDAPFRVYLRDKFGNPVVNDSSVYIHFNSCSGVLPCPLAKQGSDLYPIGHSDAQGVVSFYYAGGGCDALCTATIRSWCGDLGTVPVKSFDRNTDFAVSPVSDFNGSLCNDYNGNGSVEYTDRNIFDQHLNHYCGLTPCERFGAVFRLPTESNLMPGQVVTLELALSNNNFDSCSIGFIGFYASGFGTGQGEALITNYPYNKALAPGEMDTITVSYTVPGIGHGCLSAKFTTSCCASELILSQCAQSIWRCAGDTSLCYQFNVKLNDFPVDSVRRYQQLPSGWSAVDDHLPLSYPVNVPDSILYRICAPTSVNLGDTAAVYLYVYSKGNRIPTRFVNAVGITSRTGDCDANCIVNISDVVYIISYIFSDGPAPKPCQSGDVNCDGIVNISDAVYLVSYIFSGGPPPCLPEPNAPIPNCGK